LGSRILGGGAASKDADAQAISKGTASLINNYKDYFANAATILSVSITTTKQAVVVVFAAVDGYIQAAGVPTALIKRGGVDKTVNHQNSGVDANGNYQVTIWAWETLPAGTYQYDLIATADQNLVGVSLKAVDVG